MERKRSEVVVDIVDITLQTSHGLIITPIIKEKNVFQKPLPKK
jgi:predicted transcriptional regulator